MHPLLLYDIARQKQAEEIRRAEQARLATAVIREDHGLRRRLAAIWWRLPASSSRLPRREVRKSSRSEAA